MTRRASGRPRVITTPPSVPPHGCIISMGARRRNHSTGGEARPGESMMASQYMREKALRDQGITVRRANHFEQRINEYGEKLTWVIDRGEVQALIAYRTKEDALRAAEQYEA